MATQVGGTGSAPGVVEQFEQLIKRFGFIAAALAGIAVSLATLWKGTLPQIQWDVVALAAGALLFVVIARVAMPAIEARRRRKVIAIPESSLRGPTTFRLRPYDEADHASFDRPDDAHHEALRWLERAERALPLPHRRLGHRQKLAAAGVAGAGACQARAADAHSGGAQLWRPDRPAGGCADQAGRDLGQAPDLDRRCPRAAAARRRAGPAGPAAGRDRPVRGVPDPAGRGRPRPVGRAVPRSPGGADPRAHVPAAAARRLPRFRCAAQPRPAGSAQRRQLAQAECDVAGRRAAGAR